MKVVDYQGHSEERQHLINVEGTFSIRSEVDEQYFLVGNLTVTPLSIYATTFMQLLFIEERSRQLW